MQTAQSFSRGQVPPLAEPRAQYEWLFLPRPWLIVDEERVRSDVWMRFGVAAVSCRCQFVYDQAALVYAKGTVAVDGREALYLPYWHKVAMVGIPFPLSV